ncbi:MAG: hypothetical protein ABW224_19610 [Kibdelosporangium sp.]
MKNRPVPVRVPARDDEAHTEELTPSLATETTETMTRVESAPGLPPEPQPSSHRRTPVRTRQLAKIAGLGVATVVLCASVAAASIINSRRQAESGTASRPVAEMTNEQALLPSLFSLGSVTMPRMTTELPAPNKGSAAATVENPGPGRRAVDNNKQLSGPQAVAAEDPNPVDADLVKRYYKLLAEQPTQALGLLDGVLRQSDLSHFVDSWTQVRSIEVVDVQKRAEGELLAVVHMMLPDGGKARVHQLLKVSESIPQRITGAEIVSAQRS